MCALSVIMQSGLNEPASYFRIEQNRLDFERRMREARENDIATGQPDCENDEKKAALQAIADQLGVKIEFPT